MKKMLIGILAGAFLIAFCGVAAAQWETSGSTMPGPGNEAGKAFFIDGKIYAIGGFDSATFTFSDAVRIFDPVTDTWTSGATAPIKLTRYAAATDGEKIYFIFGIDDGASTTVVNIYDPATDSWSTGAAVTLAEGVQAAFDPVSGYIYTWGRGLPTKVYDPETDTFESDVATQPGGDFLTCGGVIGGDLVVAGGVDSLIFSPPPLTPEALDIGAGTWSTLSPVAPLGRWDHGCALYSDELYVLGGRFAGWDDFLDDVYTFAPAKGTWTAIDSLPVAVAGAWAVNAENYLFAGGGRITAGQNTTTYYLKMANADPEITSDAVTEVVADDLYEYDVEAFDIDFYDELEFELLDGPMGMVIDSVTGEITWDTTDVDPDDYDVEVSVDDGDTPKGTDTQAFTVTVTAPGDDDTTGDDDTGDDDTGDDDTGDDDTGDDDAADDDAADDDATDDDATDDDTAPIGGDDDDDDSGCGC
ncbi:MAG: kelch repeat-containing protein [Candidatus Lernaella stagnicola]|nr:kelch repeat-containing protein [Candidatus Lernaella stagnicola]